MKVTILLFFIFLSSLASAQEDLTDGLISSKIPTVDIPGVSAKAKCTEQAKISALDEIKDIITSEIANGNELDVPTAIELGASRLANPAKMPKGVSEGIWVRYKISFGKDVRDFEQLFFFDKNCVRNKRAEILEGKNEHFYSK